MMKRGSVVECVQVGGGLDEALGNVLVLGRRYTVEAHRECRCGCGDAGIKLKGVDSGELFNPIRFEQRFFAIDFMIKTEKVP